MINYGNLMDYTNLAEYFCEDSFIPSLKAETKDEVIREMIQPLIELDMIKSENILYQTLIKRETLGSTGIGKAIAIPHCRTLSVTDISIVVGISAKGIPFNSIDNKDVKILFLIVAPPREKNNQYLPILGKIVELVHEPSIRKALLKVKDFESLINLIKQN